MLEHFFTDRPIQHGMGVCLVAKQEGDIQYLGFRHKIGNRASRGQRQFLRAQLHGFDTLAFTAEGSGIEVLHLVAPGCAFFDLACKHIDADALV